MNLLSFMLINTIKCLPDFCDINFYHLEHRLGGTLSPFGITAAD